MKNQAIVVRKYGGPSVLKLENTKIDAPGRNEILLRQTGIGVNYHDIYVRSGLYKTLDLPGIPGCEGVGIIEKNGAIISSYFSVFAGNIFKKSAEFGILGFQLNEIYLAD